MSINNISSYGKRIEEKKPVDTTQKNEPSTSNSIYTHDEGETTCDKASKEKKSADTPKRSEITDCSIHTYDDGVASGENTSGNIIFEDLLCEDDSTTDCFIPKSDVEKEYKPAESYEDFYAFSAKLDNDPMVKYWDNYCRVRYGGDIKYGIEKIKENIKSLQENERNEKRQDYADFYNKNEEYIKLIMNGAEWYPNINSDGLVRLKEVLNTSIGHRYDLLQMDIDEFDADIQDALKKCLISTDITEEDKIAAGLIPKPDPDTDTNETTKQSTPFSSIEELMDRIEEDNQKAKMENTLKNLDINLDLLDEYQKAKSVMPPEGWTAFFGNEDAKIREENSDYAQKIIQFVKDYPDSITDEEFEKIQKSLKKCNIDIDIERKTKSEPVSSENTTNLPVLNSEEFETIFLKPVDETKLSLEKNETIFLKPLKEETISLELKKSDTQNANSKNNNLFILKKPSETENAKSAYNSKETQDEKREARDKVVASSQNLIGFGDDLIADYEKNHSKVHPYTYTCYKGDNKIEITKHNNHYEAALYDKDGKYLRSTPVRNNEIVYKNGDSINSEKLPNGKIDESFTQGRVGDCWLLATINGLKSREKGLEILNDSLQLNDDYSVTVDLKGKNKKYTITLDELLLEKGSMGDYDVKAIELAVKKHMEEENALILGKFEGNIANTASEMLTGKSSTKVGALWECFTNWAFGFSDKQIMDFNDKSKIFVGATKINGGYHAISVLGSDDKYVYIHNSWRQKEEKITWEKFRKDFFNVEEISIT